MRRAALMLLLLTAVIWPLSKSYDVVPYKCCIGTAPGDPLHGVTQYVRNTLDSVTFAWFWAGDTFTSDRFRVEIRDSVSGDLIAQSRNQGSHASQCWSWLPCTLVTTQGRKPVRGRTYKVVVSRPSGGAIWDRI